MRPQGGAYLDPYDDIEELPSYSSAANQAAASAAASGPATPGYSSYVEDWVAPEPLQPETLPRQRLLPEGFGAKWRIGWVRWHALAYGVLSLLLILALGSYSPVDNSWNSSGAAGTQNLLGQPGAVLADFIVQLFGYSAFFLPCVAIVMATQVLSHGRVPRLASRLIYLALGLTLFSAALNITGMPSHWGRPDRWGGALGYLLQYNLKTWLYLPYWASALVALVPSLMLLGSAMGIAPREWQRLAEAISDRLVPLGQEAGHRVDQGVRQGLRSAWRQGQRSSSWLNRAGQAKKQAATSQQAARQPVGNQPVGSQPVGSQPVGSRPGGALDHRQPGAGAPVAPAAPAWAQQAHNQQARNHHQRQQADAQPMPQPAAYPNQAPQHPLRRNQMDRRQAERLARGPHVANLTAHQPMAAPATPGPHAASYHDYNSQPAAMRRLAEREARERALAAMEENARQIAAQRAAQRQPSATSVSPGYGAPLSAQRIEPTNASASQEAAYLSPHGHAAPNAGDVAPAADPYAAYQPIVGGDFVAKHARAQAQPLEEQPPMADAQADLAARTQAALEQMAGPAYAERASVPQWDEQQWDTQQAYEASHEGFYEDTYDAQHEDSLEDDAWQAFEDGQQQAPVAVVHQEEQATALERDQGAPWDDSVDEALGFAPGHDDSEQDAAGRDAGLDVEAWDGEEYDREDGCGQRATGEDFDQDDFDQDDFDQDDFEQDDLDQDDLDQDDLDYDHVDHDHRDAQSWQEQDWSEDDAATAPALSAAPAQRAAVSPPAAPVSTAPVQTAAAVSASNAGYRPAGYEPEPMSAEPMSAERKVMPVSSAQLAVQSHQGTYEPPRLDYLSDADPGQLANRLTAEEAHENARMLESVLSDFNVKGTIVNVKPGPVVTLYELEPAPGTKTSRVVGLADDIARSMSALSARIAVVPGRNVIGIELPNPRRETVYFREMLESQAYREPGFKLPLALGKDIGGEPVAVDLAKMPHLLIAGTTGSGKSVAVNTMILSLLYRLGPEQCKFIMIDPKMLELSVYDGIPHLLCPTVVDPKKAVVALNWAVREMEDRYKAMSQVGVRNIAGFNKRLAEARAKGEVILRRVQTGFNPETGEAVFEEQEMDLTPLPYIVIIIDELADLMLVAGKDIESALQRLAQMARAAGLHLVMATQRPSVDVITGTIKANFPTRISFHVTSKIDSRTILGEMGAEQLLGMGDMLYQPSGGRLKRVHGPFSSDDEVEKVVSFLKAQGAPSYIGSITEEADADESDERVDDEAAGVGQGFGHGFGNSGDELYDQAVAIVLKHKKASTSFVQRQLQIGYNRAARLIERMEEEGLISSSDHVGRRQILVGGDSADI